MPFNRNSKPILIVALMVGLIFLSGLVYVYFFNTLERSEPTQNSYHIAYDNTWYPLQLYDKEQYIVHFSEDILREVAIQEKFSVKFIQTGSEYLFDGLDNKDYDGILSSQILYGEQKDKYISSKPYYYLGPVLVTSTSANIHSFKDLNGKNIGLILRSGAMNSLRKYTSTHFFYYDYNDRFKLLNDVLNGVLNGMVVDVMSAYEYKNSGMFKGELRIASLPLGEKGLHLIANNDTEGKKLIRRFDEGLKTLENSSLYSQLISRWGLFNPMELENRQIPNPEKPIP